DLVLRRFGEAGDEPLVRGEEPIDPAGRAAAAGNGGGDLRENIEAVFESAISARLHDAKKGGLPHALDPALAAAALGCGPWAPLAGPLGGRARARQQIGNTGFGDRGLNGIDWHRAVSPSGGRRQAKLPQSADASGLVHIVATQSISTSNGPCQAETQMKPRAGGSAGK